ncbi:hypothetical protein [Ralstonia sp.]|uniref:hypothetical protein n=1 Tax=Ralstonia sp. TaxID=54061 RepID=UPI0031CE3A09
MASLDDLSVGLAPEEVTRLFSFGPSAIRRIQPFSERKMPDDASADGLKETMKPGHASPRQAKRSDDRAIRI